MKLMFLNPTKADLEFIGWLRTQTQHEIITVNSNQVSNVMTQRTTEAKLQAFNSLIDGKQTGASNDDADWKTIDNLEHNKTLDLSQ